MSQRVKVKVSAGARGEKVEVTGDGSLKVRVTAPPEKGKANKRVLQLVAEHFAVPVSQLVLVGGHTKRDKVIELL